MSNAMSSSKSRWKGALLAAVAGAAVSPMLAHAQSMSIGIYANPLGGTSTNDYTGKSNVYIDPYSTDTLYVYATLYGSQAPSPSYTYGLDFAYYNVNAAVTSGSATGLGNVSGAQLSSLFGGGAFNGSGGVEGAQTGNVSTGLLTSTPTVVVGDSTGSNITALAKPRAYNNAFWNSSTGSGASVIVAANGSGYAVSFELETLTYTPNKTNTLGSAISTPTQSQAIAFNVSIPTSVTSPYVEANYFVGLNNPTAGASAGASNTSTGNVSSGSSLTLNDALPGDFNLDGSVNGLDLSALASDFGATSGATYHTGDWNGDGAANGLDLSALSQYFGYSAAGGAPSGLSFAQALDQLEASDPALAAAIASSVPEPTTLALFGIAGLGLLRRRRRA